MFGVSVMNGWIFLGITAAICVAAFLNGLRFSRMTKNPWTGKSMLGMPVEGGQMPLERLRMFGRLQMLAAPLFLILAGALCFGLLGPVEGIETIKLN